MATRYQVHIRYMNGTEQTYAGSYAYCSRVRRTAFRMGHGLFDIERIA